MLTDFKLLAASAVAVLAITAAPPPIAAAKTGTPPEVVANGSAQIAPVAYPQSTRERMLRILRAEWEERGRFPLDMTAGRPDETVRGYANEYDPDGFSRVLAYWSVLANSQRDSDAAYIDFNRRLANTRQFGARHTDAKGNLSVLEVKKYCGTGELGFYSGSDSNAWIWGCRPWSAAFISYIMMSAGVSAAEFLPSSSHRGYVDHLLRHYNVHEEAALFIPHNRLEYRPRVGDLICATRGGSDLNRWTDRWNEIQASNPPERAMHCDIVHEVNDGSVVAIGGNVVQTVAASRFRLTDAPKPEDRRLDTNARNFFVIFENRMGLARPTK